MEQNSPAVGAPVEPTVRPLVEKMRDYAAQAGHYGAWGGGALLENGADEIERLRGLYEELLFAVGNKCPGETRHQTALRYIQKVEAPDYPFGGQGGGLTTCDMHDDESY